MIILICQYCNNSFKVLPYRAKIAKCCSRKCSWHITKTIREPLRIKAISGKKAINNQQLSKKCIACKSEFWISPSRNDITKFCSKKCYTKAMTIEGKRIYKKLTINGKRILEHRYIMQQFLGRTLSRKEHVHHINHDTLDNRIENLELLDIVEHGKLHKRGPF